MTVRAAAKRARASVSRSLPAASLSAPRRAPCSGTGDKSLGGFAASWRSSPSPRNPQARAGRYACCLVCPDAAPAPRWSAVGRGLFSPCHPLPSRGGGARWESQASVSAGGGGCCAAGTLGRWGGVGGCWIFQPTLGDLARRARRVAAHEEATAWPAVSPSFGAPCSPTTVLPELSWRPGERVFFFSQAFLWSQEAGAGAGGQHALAR